MFWSFVDSHRTAAKVAVAACVLMLAAGMCIPVAGFLKRESWPEYVVIYLACVSISVFAVSLAFIALMLVTEYVSCILTRDRRRWSKAVWFVIDGHRT